MGGIRIYNNIKKYRENCGQSQEIVAKNIGITRQTLSLIELNKYNPTLKLCIMIARYFGTDLNALFWRKEYEKNKR
ncbi:hypothetical protein AEH57_00680 [Lactococcus garvieae]|uniref:Transcriptional regulator n=2 Tax=Streptococcaceae TaxID=1300 RepID=A0A1B0Z2S4_9LACT|nr:helix-turn-helix transcriptional regulator [Lactococcus lactis]ANO58552.1 transcriptional regulator [Lactococcus garvieae]PST73171.1 hypothetical protein AEH57_00680 [Lactococcus garvieae]TYR21173.1 helix-turn-helix transcriptional regulator [Lactococcus lactis subsp. lactis bv. diacetylactis]